jgi:RNA polymerase sigma factor (TIGR02999 family)
MSEVTRILEAIEQGQPKAAGELLPLVYDELRRLATHKMASERAGHTLQPTALVHEAWLRLAGNAAGQHWDHRGHFFAAAAEAMRRILVEHARRKARQKRGSGQERLSLEDVELPVERDEKILLIHELLDELEAEDFRLAQVVKLRFFAGLEHAEIARLQGVSEKTIKRHWAYAKAWLSQRMRDKP